MENVNMETIFLFSHTDLDGYGSEIVLRAFGHEAEIIHLDNHEVNEILNIYVDRWLNKVEPLPSRIYITDIYPNEEVANKINLLYQDGLSIHLFDHHQTALYLNEYPWARVIPEQNGVLQCGTSLFYQFLVEEAGLRLEGKSGKALERMVELIRLYDTWEWQSQAVKEAKLLNDLFYLLGPEKFINARLSQIQLGDDKQDWTDFEDSLLSIENNRIQAYLQQKEKEMIIVPDFFTDENGNPLVAGVVQADSYTSELGHYLCNKHPEIDFAMMLRLTQNKASLRASKEEVDLTPIVKRYEGGGHKHAAGCKITPMGHEFILKVWDRIQLK